MKVEIALALSNRINREVDGLRHLLKQLDKPERALSTTGLQSALVILSKSLLRVCLVASDIIRAEIEPPAAARPAAASSAGREAFDAFANIFRK